MQIDELGEHPVVSFLERVTSLRQLFEECGAVFEEVKNGLQQSGGRTLDWCVVDEVLSDDNADERIDFQASQLVENEIRQHVDAGEPLHMMRSAMNDWMWLLRGSCLLYTSP